MTILMWRILCLCAAVLFVACVIILLVTNLTKNKYYFDYHDDELLKKEKCTNSVNSIYMTSGETKRFIKKYVVCKSTYEKYLVCNFAQKFEDISFFVVQFSKRKKVISVLEIKQRDVVGDSSKIIALRKSCAHVNVVVGTVDGKVINRNYVRPISMYRLRLYAVIKSLAIFAALFALRHIIIEVLGGGALFGKDVALQYLENSLNYIAIGASFILSVFSYLITVLGFRRKNARAFNGGALEYEFV